MSITLRTAFTITVFIGAIYAALGLIFSPTPTDFGIGLAIVGAALAGQGLIDWIDR